MRRRAAAALAATALLLTGGCDGGRDRGTDDHRATSTTVAGAPGGTAAPTSAVPPTTGAARGDWDGVRFDLGIVDRIDRTEDGRTLIVFDRVQLAGGASPTSAADFHVEPVIVGNTDSPFINDNTRLRTYVAADDVEVLRVANLRRTCSDLRDREEPQWARLTVDDAVSAATWTEHRQVSLTFGPDGLVSRIRFAAAC